MQHRNRILMVDRIIFHRCGWNGFEWLGQFKHQAIRLMFQNLPVSRSTASAAGTRLDPRLLSVSTASLYPCLLDRGLENLRTDVFRLWDAIRQYPTGSFQLDHMSLRRLCVWYIKEFTVHRLVVCAGGVLVHTHTCKQCVSAQKHAFYSRSSLTNLMKTSVMK